VADPGHGPREVAEAQLGTATEIPAQAVAHPEVRYSIVIPVYGNEGSIDALLERLGGLTTELDGRLEVVFVVDGSPDRSYAILRHALKRQPFSSTLLAHSRNFGSFAAIRTGLIHATGEYAGVMAADLQEPPELMLDFFATLAADEADIVVGTRGGRADPGSSALAARIFWGLYRRLVQREMPAGGVDVFACTAEFRRHLVAFGEANTSLVALTLWLGFRRETVNYDRLAREHGASGWTLRKKVKYLSDSIFSFTDLPIRVLLGMGLIGIVTSLLLAVIVVLARASGAIHVPGYAATIMVIAFFSALNLCGLGIIGAYVWRAFENTKERPVAVVMDEQRFDAEGRA
jgi:glycosyltransferase involved in cell wall biosynthesis